MYRFAICDDSQTDADYVASLVEAWKKEAGLPLKLEQYPSAEAFLFAYEEDSSFDVLFLDIEMGGMSGVELAKKLRQMGAGLQLVFVTGYMEYIAEGYDVEALHYLIKPVTGEKMNAVLNRAIERLKTREHALLLALPEGRVRVPLYEIRYLEVLKNYVTVHADMEYSVKRTLNELEKELDESFYRIHRSYIVNLRFIKKITRAEVELKDGAVLPISRKVYEGLNQAVIQYF